jgi:hypothetical protein
MSLAVFVPDNISPANVSAVALSLWWLQGPAS